MQCWYSTEKSVAGITAGCDLGQAGFSPRASLLTTLTHVGEPREVKGRGQVLISWYPACPAGSPATPGRKRQGGRGGAWWVDRHAAGASRRGEPYLTRVSSELTSLQVHLCSVHPYSPCAKAEACHLELPWHGPGWSDPSFLLPPLMSRSLSSTTSSPSRFAVITSELPPCCASSMVLGSQRTWSTSSLPVPASWPPGPSWHCQSLLECIGCGLILAGFVYSYPTPTRLPGSCRCPWACPISLINQYQALQFCWSPTPIA
jgi:hypothetical protein